MSEAACRPNPDDPAASFAKLKADIKNELMKIPLEELTEENVYDVVSEFFQQNGNYKFIIEGGKL